MKKSSCLLYSTFADFDQAWCQSSHPSIFLLLSLAGCRGNNRKQRTPDLCLPSHPVHFPRGHPRTETPRLAERLILSSMASLFLAASLKVTFRFPTKWNVKGLGIINRIRYFTITPGRAKCLHGSTLYNVTIFLFFQFSTLGSRFITHIFTSKSCPVQGDDSVILAICCVDQISLYADLYVGHPPSSRPLSTHKNAHMHTLTHTQRGVEDWHRLIPFKSLAAVPLSKFLPHFHLGSNRGDRFSLRNPRTSSFKFSLVRPTTHLTSLKY